MENIQAEGLKISVSVFPCQTEKLSQRCKSGCQKIPHMSTVQVHDDRQGAGLHRGDEVRAGERGGGEGNQGG